jgi:hypothetical protein
MKLFEMYDAPVQGYQDVSNDSSKYRYGDTRKTKLTLKQLRKLRKMLDVRNYEHNKNLKKVRKQYTPAAAEGPAL